MKNKTGQSSERNKTAGYKSKTDIMENREESVWMVRARQQNGRSQKIKTIYGSKTRRQKNKEGHKGLHIQK